MPRNYNDDVNDDDDCAILVDNEQPIARTPTLTPDLGSTNNYYVYDSDDEDEIRTLHRQLSQLMNGYDDDDDDEECILRDANLNQKLVKVTEAPPDSYNYTYIVFYLLGASTMIPWNFFVTAEDYWMYKFRNTTINESNPDTMELTPMQKSFTCDLTLTASISGTIFLILNVIYGHYVSLKLKMLGTLIIIFILFIFTTIFVEINTDHWQEQFFLITLFMVVVLNVCSATMSGGLFGIAGLFPSEYMTAVVSGQALSGILTALTFIAVLAFGTGPEATAFIFFIIGTVFVLLSIITYWTMSKKPFFQYYLNGGDKYEVLCETPTHSAAIMPSVALEPNVKEVFGKVYVLAAGLLILYTTTLSIYPAVTVLMQSQNYGSGSAWSDTYYMPVVNYLFFNCGDYFGRIIAGIYEKPRDNPHTVLLMVLVRILYIPFFLCSNTNLHIYLPTLVQTDLAFIIMIITFALGNGYLTNIILIMAPRTVQQHERELASAIMAATLSCGLALGSMLSMLFVRML